jgi:hypothetical protein
MMSRELSEVTIIDQLPKDLTKDRFLAQCQPKIVKYGMNVLVPTIDGTSIRFHNIPLTRVMFACGRDAFIGYDAVEQQWWCRL